MANKERNATFDIMKGIGILLVITCHFFGWNHPVMDRVINSFHMPMFFIVAGYFSKPHIDRVIDWHNIKKYRKRLLPAFIFTQMLIVGWGAMMAFAGKGSWQSVISDSLSTLWADPFGPQLPFGHLSIGVIWFLLALLIAKILLIPLSKSGRWAIPISIVLAYCAILIHRVFPYSIFCISHGLTALPFVTIGWWAKNHTIPLWIKIASIAGWCVALFVSHLGMYDVDWGCYPLDVLAACGGTYCLYLICKVIDKYAKPCCYVLSLLGVWSLAIMCIHCFEMSARLGNHVMGLLSLDLPIWGEYLTRYVVTIGLAISVYYLPFTKKIFA